MELNRHDVPVADLPSAFAGLRLVQLSDFHCSRSVTPAYLSEAVDLAQAQNGDVIEWEPHGLECAVCIDVATRSRQMHASGASVAQIRATVEKEFAPNFPTMTPTPKPPPAGTHN